MRHSPASISTGFRGGGGGGGVKPASTPLRRMEQAEKEPVAVTRLRIRQEAAWTTSSKDSWLPLSAGRVGTGWATTTSFPGPRPAHPSLPSGEEGGRGPERRDEAGHKGWGRLYLCAPNLWYAAASTSCPPCAQSRWVPRVPGAAAATPVLLLLKEDSTQPNSWLSQHRAQAT